MITSIRIDCRKYAYKPGHLLHKAGYHPYIKSKTGAKSYIKPDKEGRFEAYVIGQTIDLHYDVWVGKDKHMVLPSDYRTPKEKNRIIAIMLHQAEPTPRVNAWKERKRQRKKELQIPVFTQGYVPEPKPEPEPEPEPIPVVESDFVGEYFLPGISEPKVGRKNTLSAAQIKGMDWDYLRRLNDQNKSFPHTTTCICFKNMIRYFHKQINTLLMTCKKIVNKS